MKWRVEYEEKSDGLLAGAWLPGGSGGYSKRAALEIVMDLRKAEGFRNVRLERDVNPDVVELGLPLFRAA